MNTKFDRFISGSPLCGRGKSEEAVTLKIFGNRKEAVRRRSDAHLPLCL
jgi:hypothetical protein